LDSQARILDEQRELAAAAAAAGDDYVWRFISRFSEILQRR
jgi:hypothetical protein